MLIKNKKVLVTGAGGFIGSHLARTLYEMGNFIRAVDIKWDGFLPEPYCSEKLTLDLRQFSNCTQATQGIDWVFNLAADMGGIYYITNHKADLVSSNTLINLNMLRASVQNKTQKVFFASSACIYPVHLQANSKKFQDLKESDAYPAQPDSFYGWEKLFSEKLFEAYAIDYNLDVRISRFHNIFGPYGVYEGGLEKAPAGLCRKIALAEDPGEIEIWGDGKQSRSFCYIDDCIRGILMLMESNYDEPLNIGSDRMVSIDELADMIIDISGKKIKKNYNQKAPQGVRVRNADLSLVKDILGWQPRVSLKEGLVKTYTWIKNQLEK